jgi:thimet oligopeptidase
MLASLLLVTAAASHAAAGFYPSPRLKYDPTPAQLSKHCGEEREKALANLKVIATLNPGAASFQTAPEALENTLYELSDQTAADSFLKYVSISSTVRQAGHECETLLEQFSVETFTREDLYQSIKDYAANKKEPLDGEPKKLLEKELLDFKRSGLELTPEKRAEVKRIRLRLAEIEAQFAKNINDVKDTLSLTRAEMDGVPETLINRLPKDGELYKISLDYPDYFPFMNNAKNPDARRRLEGLFNNRAEKENLPILAEVLDLRRKAAELLGYQSHAHYVIEERMAKKPANVREFLEGLQKKLKPLAKEELKVLLALKAAEEKNSDGILHAWDWRFYDNLLKKTKYEVDEEKIKEYFPLEVVRDGMLKVYQHLLDVRFREVTDAVVWAPDVKLFEVTDARSNEVLGYFYMDLYPREGKYKHAAAFSLIKGRRLPDGSYQKPVSAMVANFDKPTKDRPSLMPHKEVETFFHEFGHIMHQTLTKARYGRFSGSSVARDFVEAPSQMLENWVWDPQVLPMLSGHFKDHSKKLPPEMLVKMIAAKNVNAGLVYLRQDFFASVDLRYHTAPKIKDTTAEYAEMMKDISQIPMSPGTHPEASFGHLMGYDAGYYGYLWSEVFAQDMFSRFEREGVLSPLVGRLYREIVLEKGSSIDEMQILRGFLGRAPNDDAFLRSIGLKGKN